jgi:hypothetical protein
VSRSPIGTSQYGMQTFDQSLFQLYKNGLITLDEALRRATNPDEFKLKIQGVQFTSDAAREQMEEQLQAVVRRRPPGGRDLRARARVRSRARPARHRRASDHCP